MCITSVCVCVCVGGACMRVWVCGCVCVCVFILTYGNIKVFHSFILQCNLLQSVMYYKVILEFDSNIVVCITACCNSNDEKCFQTVKI